MDWFLGLFLITSVWALWVVPVVFFFIILAFAENEKNFFAGISLIIFTAIMYHSGFIILTDPWVVAKYFAYYFAIGALWSTIKWWRYLTGKANNFKVSKVKFIKRLNQINKDNPDFLQMGATHKTKIPEEINTRFKDFIIDELGLSYSQRAVNREDKTISEIVIPTAQDNKERITTWILWWPTSLFWTILNDPLVKLANAIYDRFQGIYSRISNMVFKDVGL